MEFKLCACGQHRRSKLGKNSRKADSLEITAAGLAPLALEYQRGIIQACPTKSSHRRSQRLGTACPGSARLGTGSNRRELGNASAGEGGSRCLASRGTG